MVTRSLDRWRIDEGRVDVVLTQSRVWSGARDVGSRWAVHSAEFVRWKTQETQPDPVVVSAAWSGLLHWRHRRGNLRSRSPSAAAVLQLVQLFDLVVVSYNWYSCWPSCCACDYLRQTKLSVVLVEITVLWWTSNWTFHGQNAVSVIIHLVEEQWSCRMSDVWSVSNL